MLMEKPGESPAFFILLIVIVLLKMFDVLSLYALEC